MVKIVKTSINMLQVIFQYWGNKWHSLQILSEIFFKSILLHKKKQHLHFGFI